ncbi:IS3 family transposase [Spiroplasma chrysopicola]|uniref:Putative transposase n=1 Tax=Spiroplasma chrysopicola DF-1 TaxID=1276227 RepID=R4UBH3_9MOLU|nr:IS3 family transposase [Spiroplasma chrysopicola]AGM25244.1 putative transposase [Spiroplasma chrysopicola DF-1]
MGTKWFTKNEKLNILKYYKENGWAKTIKKFEISTPTLSRWKKAVKISGEKALEPGNGLQSKGIRRPGRPKNLNFELMTKKELIEYIEMIQDVKKSLPKSKKKKFQTIWSLKKKYKIKYLCKILNVSRAGYYKWFNAGMKLFNKWNNTIAKIVKTLFLTFKKIYGYNMLTLIINKLYNWNLKPHIVYRYIKNMNLKSIIRIKKFNYKLSSGNKRHENIMNQDFSTTDINQKIGTDITYLLTSDKTYFLSIVKDFHTNEILDYQISNNLEKEFVFRNIINSWVKAGKPSTWVLQSDQGFHYTNSDYEKLCNYLGITISMSRRGNSYDNAHTESWFGTMKTEFLYHIKRKKRTAKWIIENLPKYIYFYNNFRPQAKLKGMSPVQYRKSSLQVTF